MSRSVDLARIVLDTVGLPGWRVVQTDLSPWRADGSCIYGTRTIEIDAKLDDAHPADVILVVVHEAAHALSATGDHGPGWDFQVDRLVSPSSVEKIFTATIDLVVREWADELLQHQNA